MCYVLGYLLLEHPFWSTLQTEVVVRYIAIPREFMLCWSSWSHLCHLLWGQPAFHWQNSLLFVWLALYKSGSCFIITSYWFCHGITWTYILTVSWGGNFFPNFFFSQFSTNSCWFMSLYLNAWHMLVACGIGLKWVVPAKCASCNCCSMLALPLQMMMMVWQQRNIYVGVQDWECVKLRKRGDVTSWMHIHFITAICIH